MKRREILLSFLLPVFEIGGVIGLFFVAYYLRQITDGIPFIQLPIPYISQEQFFPFILTGAFFWWIIFLKAGLYRYEGETPLFETMRNVLASSAVWFLFYIAFVYLSTGFVFSKEIPRLIILYVWILSALYALFLRIFLYTLMSILYRYKYLSKNRILIIEGDHPGAYTLENREISECITISHREESRIQEIIRSKKVDMVLSLVAMGEKQSNEIIKLCSIYGIRFSYPRIPQHVYEISRSEGFLLGIPVVHTSALAMSAWDSIMKRIIDIILSSILLIILAPVFLIIWIAIQIEDSSGPSIYRNRRIGYMGKEFFLYKFRYMYWKDSVKDAYGVEKSSDAALEYEERLKQKSDTRNGPLYKIAHDPRKTKVGKFIEKLSLDELPQLWNVLIGNMSLVGPRPHQPREVDLYDEHHYQVLTVKPGITGMAQTRGREENSFEEEVAYDVYYIEKYSILLDFLILMKTISVVCIRAFR